MTELTTTPRTDPEKAATVDLQWNVPPHLADDLNDAQKQGEPND